MNSSDLKISDLDVVINELKASEEVRGLIRRFAEALLARQEAGLLKRPEEFNHIMHLTLRAYEALNEAALLGNVTFAEPPLGSSTFGDLTMPKQFTQWIREMAHAQAANGLDIEAEYIKAYSAEIASVVFNAVIETIFKGSEHYLVDLTLRSQTADGHPAFIGDSFTPFFQAVDHAAEEIGKVAPGKANVIFASPMLISVMQSSTKSMFRPAVEGSFKGPNHVMLVGTLDDKYDVYCYLPNLGQHGINAPDKAIVAYRGKDFADAGIEFRSSLLIAAGDPTPDGSGSDPMVTESYVELKRPDYFKVLDVNMFDFF